MDEYAGRVLAGRYRLPRPPADEFELVETRAFDTYSGQEVLVRQLLLPEVVHAEVVGDETAPDAAHNGAGDSAGRALEAARAAAAVPDHPALVQVFDVLVEDGSLWVVSELVPARPIASLLADRRLSPYRAAEVAADLLGALRALHARGWAHRNITARTVLVCEDGRAMLDGLAFGAAQEALCGYDPVPREVLAGAGGEDRAERGGWGGPDSALALERARQARITVIGPVTERWAPEQAGPVHQNWQLAPPVGPAADLWALGALLFRCVQGHPPFPEESAAELVDLVCAEPPAHAEDCGPLRPVVESLLRQDPTERPEFEELSGWLRSLVRSAPEPDIGARMVQVPAGPGDPHKLPVVRRRGELVRLRRRRRTGGDAMAAAPQHGRHARSRGQRPAPAGAAGETVEVRRRTGQLSQTAARTPHRMGLLLVGLVLLLLAALVLYAVLFMPKGAGGVSSRSLPAQVSGGVTAGRTEPASQDAPTPTDRSTQQAPSLGSDFTVRGDPAGFSIAVHNGWTRAAGPNGETVFSSGGDVMQLVVVVGRDSTAAYGADPLAYLDREPELAPFRSSTWSSAAGLKRLDAGGAAAAEGEFTWRDPDSGNQVYGRDMAVARGGRYDIVLLTGPDDQRSVISEYFDKATLTFRANG
ncbi:protein kinase [Streptomyces sp. RPT161]|uniref:protein kinase n=1 Tax=Streptomyces sp. RPT161 TaxID=3015993 RepID=UPI0022B905FB|nr:protein kinase [Streptomyces sp. RPT161]